MKRADLHTHTALCRHAEDEPEQYLLRAEELKLDYFGVSDHFPSPSGYDSLFRMTPEELPRYREIVRSLQKQGAEKGIRVLYGAEADYVAGRTEEVASALAEENFDYVLGSVHFIGDFAFDDPALLEEWKTRNADELWNAYAENILNLVDSLPVQILSHADLIRKFGFYPKDQTQFRKTMYEAFALAGEKGLALEINTAGILNPAGSPYPSLELLKAARQAGMKLTFGSDAHKAANVAHHFDLALELAKAAGFTSHFIFEQKVPLELPFEDC